MKLVGWLTNRKWFWRKHSTRKESLDYKNISQNIYLHKHHSNISRVMFGGGGGCFTFDLYKVTFYRRENSTLHFQKCGTWISNEYGWHTRKSRNSTVGIAIGYQLDNKKSEFESWQSQEFSFSTSSRPALVSTQPPIQWVLVALSQEQSGRGVKPITHLKLSAKVKKMWIYTSTTRCLHGVVLS
jgi:hypothetical protein